jgi:ABC-2 type transport system permease protein
MNATTALRAPDAPTAPTAPPWRGNLRSYWLEAVTESLKTVRMPAYALPTLGFPAVFYVMFAVVLSRANTSGFPMGTYLLATYGCFGVIGAALFAFGVGVAVERGQGWMVLKRALPAPAGSWIAGKLAMSVAFASVIAGVLSMLAAGIAGVRLAPAAWLGLWTVLVLGSIPFCAFGLALGYLCGPNSAPAVVNLIYLPMALVSGLWFPAELLPKSMTAAAAWLPAYHYAQLALGAVGAGRGGPAWSHVAVLAGYTLVSMAVALYAYRNDEDKTFG